MVVKEVLDLMCCAGESNLFIGRGSEETPGLLGYMIQAYGLSSIA